MLLSSKGKLLKRTNTLLNPLTIFGNDLIVWYRGDTVSNNLFLDRSGKGNNSFLVASNPVAPTLNSTGFNGKPCLEFTFQQALQLPNCLNNSWGQANLFVLYDLATTANHWALSTTGVATDHYWGTSSVFNFSSLFGEFRNNRLGFHNNGQISTVGQALIEISSGPSGYLIHRNTTQLLSTTADWGVTAIPYIGRDWAATKWFHGKLAEWFVVRREPTITERNQTRSYFKNFWNLTIY